MHYIYISFIVLLIVIIIVLSILYANERKNERFVASCDNLSQKLWLDHVWFTRYYMLSVLDNSPEEGRAVALKRLLQNQTDINNYFQNKYGNHNDELEKLLDTHIKIAGDVLTSLKNNDAQGVKTNMEKWSENDDKIASFLAPILNIDAGMIKNLLTEHMNLTANEAVYHFNHQYDKEITNMDAIINNAMTIANAL